MELIKNTVAMGMTKEISVLQNIAITLNKIITSPLAIEFDKEENKNVLNLLVLIIQYWVSEIIEEAMERLEKLAQDQRLPPSDRNLIFRVVSQISSTIDIKTVPHYNKAHFHNWQSVDNITKPDGAIISRSNLYKPPIDHKQYERGIKPPLYAQTPNILNSRSKKYRDPNKKTVTFNDEFGYNTEQPEIGSRLLGSTQSMSTINRGTIQSINFKGAPLKHSGAMQFTTVNSPMHVHDPCFFEEQEQAQYRSAQKQKKNLSLDNTGSYLVNPYKVTFFKGDFPSLEKLPPIQMVYSGDLLKDYCTMLNPELNQRDVVIFALHSIDNMGQRQRAIDLLENNGIQRLLKNFKFQSSNMKKLIIDLIYSVLTFTKDIIDIPLLVNLTLFQNQEIRNAGIKAICEISDPADLEGKIKQAQQDRIDITFHIHIPYIVQCCDKKNPSTFRNYALQILANLCNREYLKSYVTFNKGIECLVDAIKDTSNLNGMRIAAKGLTTLAKGDSEMKVKLMSTLRQEIKDAWDGTQDPVISAYLKKMLKEGINYDT